jgi:hypothetical protein
MKSTLLVIFLTTSVLYCKSQEIKFYGKEEGVNHEIFMTGVQDNNDNIWFGGLLGIHKWDGIKFTYIKTPTKIETVKNGLVTGRLLFLSKNKDVLDYNMNVLFKIMNDKLIEVGKYKHGLVDDMGNFYGIMEKEKKKVLIKYDGIEQVILGEVGDRLNKIFNDSKRNTWFVAEDGLFRIHGNKFEKFPKENLIKGKSVGDIFEDSKGRIWLSVYEDGVYCFNDSTFHKYTNDVYSNSVSVNRFGETGNGIIWAVHSMWGKKYSEIFEYVSLFDNSKWVRAFIKSGPQQDYHFNPLVNTSLLPISHLDSIAISSVMFYEFMNSNFNCPVYSSTHNVNDHWIINDGTVKITIGDDKYRGRGGLFKYEIKKGTFSPISEMVMLSLFESNNGDMWFSSKKELFKYNDNIGFTFLTETKNREATFFFEDKIGNIWVGTYFGLYYIPKK